MIALDVPLAGLRRIEASAGTGKTWTVAALVARAIAEGRVDVRGLVVVTFTRAATHELRDRIRRRLVDTGRALAGDTAGLDGSDRAFLEGLLARLDDPEQARRRIDAAVRGLDEAAIFTIHGFCQRILADRAFEARTPFDTELVQDPGDLLQEAVDEHWRRELYDADPDLARAVLRACADPDTLARRYRTWFARRDLEVLAPESDLGDLRAFGDACRALAPRLAAGRDALLAWFDDDAFSGQKVRRDLVENRLALLEYFLATGDPAALNAREVGMLDKLRPDYLRGATKKNREVPEPRPAILDDVAALLDLRARAAAAADAAGRAFEARAVAAVGPAFRERKRRAGVVDFDDLLGDLRDALAAEGGGTLAARIRGRYPVAVVDEFQDTDPVQWEIFRRVWGGAGSPAALVLVGDPKQAIYSFRGADVFAYLAAGRDVEESFDLAANWRSHPALVEAVNATFSAVELPFALPDIPFRAAVPAKPPAAFEPIVDGAGPVLRLRLIPGDEFAGRTGVGVGQEVAARATAIEADRLVRAGVPAGEIAVLVRTGRQGEAVRDALAVRGLSAVLRTHESVFASASADDLGHVLRALAAPTDERRVRAALATATLGTTGEELVAMAERGTAWDETLERWRTWHDAWRRRGPARAIRGVLDHHEAESRLLARVDGARRLADLAHLVERIQAAWDAGAHGFDRLLRWFADRRADEAVAAEDETLRLDSDEDLVRIETVHASKGLEYPYVLCPFPWWMRGSKNPPERFLSYHGDDGRRVLDLRGDDDPDAAEAAAREALSEDLRLLYVALTRAGRRCEAFFVPTGANLGRSAPAWLLHDGPRESAAAFAESAAAVDEAGWLERLRALAASGPGAIEVVHGMPEEPTGARPARARADLAPRVPARRVGEGRTLTSFSALVGQVRDPAGALDRPDWDVVAVPVAAPVARDAPRTRHTFPAGAGAGRAIHRAFETIDFPRAAAGEFDGAVAAALAEHGFDAAWEPAVRAMIADALRVPVGERDDTTLAAVGARDRRVELEFTFPVEGPGGAGIDGRDLAAVLREHAAGGAWDGGPIAEEIARLEFDRVRGHVRGFIDLLCRIPDAAGGARYWLVDWKSNRLGADGAAYGREAMEAEIARHGYWLQYLLYTVAVHRLLGARRTGYDYDRDFGGVAYVFVRGVDPADRSRGVYRDRPARALVEAVDRAIGRGTDREARP